MGVWATVVQRKAKLSSSCPCNKAQRRDLGKPQVGLRSLFPFQGELDLKWKWEFNESFRIALRGAQSDGSGQRREQCLMVSGGDPRSWAMFWPSLPVTQVTFRDKTSAAKSSLPMRVKTPSHERVWKCNQPIQLQPNSLLSEQLHNLWPQPQNYVYVYSQSLSLCVSLT